MILNGPNNTPGQCAVEVPNNDRAFAQSLQPDAVVSQVLLSGGAQRRECDRGGYIGCTTEQYVFCVCAFVDSYHAPILRLFAGTGTIILALTATNESPV